MHMSENRTTEIRRSQGPGVVSALWQFFTSTIEGGKLFKGGNYSRKYGTWINCARLHKKKGI